MKATSSSLSPQVHARIAAVNVVCEVLDKGRSLDDALGRQPPSAMTQALAYGVLRHLGSLAQALRGLLDKPLKPKEQPVERLLLVALFQLADARVAEAMVVNETVVAVEAMGRGWAKGLCNAVLRRAQREGVELTHPSHPGWLRRKLKADWPEHHESIVAAANQAPPMVLRVNLLHVERERYIDELAAVGIESVVLDAPAALQLQAPVNVEALPGFATGRCSVQDLSPQWAAQLLHPAAGERVLDACAAPGGKTAHMAELAPGAKIVAIDVDAARLERLNDGMARLGHEVETHVSDARSSQWWDGVAFDAVLADVPCSGLGVIRRHPDIKWLRKPGDIAPLVALQAEILDALWALVKPGGRLLYATCSILRAENADQAAAFLERTSNAKAMPIALPSGFASGPGWQVLPDVGDGFYYALFCKE